MYHAKEFLNSLLIFPLLRFCTSVSTITPNRPVNDGDVLVSEGETFALGFFSPSSLSDSRYVGIWYYKLPEQTVVWVANRDNPITDASGVLSIDETGNIVLRDQIRKVPLWSTNVSAMATTNYTYSAQLQDTGNLVLFQGDSKRVVAWQSFDYPTNTMLPNMKFGLDRRTGLNRLMTSWKSGEDPGTGEYSYRMDVTGSPQLFLRKGSVPIWRTGPWIGHKWSGVPHMTSEYSYIFKASFVDNHDELYVMLNNASVFSRLVVNESGSIERSVWIEGENRWTGFLSVPTDQCDQYGHCGAFGYCDPYNNAVEYECTCLPGFQPKSARDWYLRDSSAGCVRKRGGDLCGKGEGFVKLAGVKVPDTSSSTTTQVDKSLGMKACEDLCLRNCSCMGYTSADINGGGNGCITWYGDILDTRKFSNGGQDLYIRVDAVELDQYSNKSKSFHRNRKVAIVVPSVTAVFLTFFLAYWFVMKNRTAFSRGNEIDESGTNADMPLFSLSTIVTATDNFSFANKLGEGGFGSVYKGHLHDGREVAVKRLSNTSGQGIKEFMNEVTLIAKLQHRNLVRLLGCCIQNGEKMLIYEYMPNKGLDSFIFDKAKGSLVDWGKRFEIILGIARGMLYLHQDSRLRIIHRDLKASNVLLDDAMNPKISDFGMARIFGVGQIEANTNRVVGTYGYMSPEYAMEGLFSMKSDVFSFGVVLLEIISGRKNNNYYEENFVNLIGHVWDLWKEGKALDIADSSLGESYRAHEVLRCIHIGLLCVQEVATDRPTMSEVALMLCNETALPTPNQPAFILKKTNNGLDSSSTSTGAKSINEVTITKLEAR